MKILHTADWHLGRSLYGRKRYAEFTAFLNWLLKIIEAEKVDALLVAGDVFDSGTPGNRAQALYYDFLCRVATTCCRHVVIIGGNHDSPSFLNAPQQLLRTLNVHVVGAVTDNLEDEVIPIVDFGLPNTGDDSCQADVATVNLQKSMIVCAVPYLRDKDVRTAEPGETIDDKNRKLVEGIQAHYAEVVKIAEHKRREMAQQFTAQNASPQIPIVAMGHLFTAGGKTVDGDGVRELYVGTLAHVSKAIFPSAIDYLALGHLHVPQMVGGVSHFRYCGSPIPMGYGEAAQEKKVVLVEFSGTTPTIQECPVPCFQELVRIVGSLTDIHTKLEALKKAKSTAWLEIEYTGNDIIGNLREMIDEVMLGSGMEIRRIKNRRLMDKVIRTVAADETLDDLDVTDVFNRCLDAFEVPDSDRAELTRSYHEIVKDLEEEDRHAE